MSSAKLAVVAASAAVTLLFGSSALAAAAPVVAVGASSSFPGYDFSFATDFAPNTDWASNGGGVGSYIDFDLGSAMQLTGFSLTDRLTSGGPNGVDTRGNTDFTTGFTLTAFTDDSFSTPTGQIASYTKAETPASGSDASAFVYTADTSINGQYIRYAVDAANGANPGLDDITFESSDDSISEAPEPSTWALMFAAVAMIGGALRYGRRRTLGAAA